MLHVKNNYKILIKEAQIIRYDIVILYMKKLLEYRIVKNIYT